MNINDLRVEGESAVADLERFADSVLGYARHNYKFGSPVERLIGDNPGLVETMLDWIKQNLLEECPYCDNYCPHIDDEDQVCEEYFMEHMR